MDTSGRQLGTQEQGQWRPQRKKAGHAGDDHRISEMHQAIGRVSPKRAPAPHAQGSADAVTRGGSLEALLDGIDPERIAKAKSATDELSARLIEVAQGWQVPNARIDAAMDLIVDSLWRCTAQMLKDGGREVSEERVKVLAVRGAMTFRAFLDRDNSEAMIARLVKLGRHPEGVQIVVGTDKELFELEQRTLALEKLGGEASTAKAAEAQSAQEVARLMAEGRPTGAGPIAKAFMALQAKLNDGVPWRDGEVDIYEGSWFFVAVSKDGRRYEFGWSPTWEKERMWREAVRASLEAMFERRCIAGILELRQGGGEHVLWPVAPNAVIDVPETRTRRGMSLELNVRGGAVEHARKWIASTFVAQMWATMCQDSSNGGVQQEWALMKFVDGLYALRLTSTTATAYGDLLAQRREERLKQQQKG